MNKDVLNSYIFSTTVIAIFIFVTWALDFFEIMTIYQNPIALFLNNMKELQALSKGVLATFGYVIYYKSSVTLLFSLGYFLDKKRYFLSIIFVLALFMTGARANVIGAILVCIIVPVLNYRTPSKKLLGVAIIVCIAALALPSIIEKLQTVTALKYERSESIKIEGMRSTFKLLNDNKYMYIFGQGLGSYFFDSGRNDYVNVFELSFIDYFRQVGIFGFLPFLYFLIKPLKYLWINVRWLFVTYLGFIIIAATNPLLINSTSFICYLLIFTCGFDDCKQCLLVKRAAYTNTGTKDNRLY